MRCRRIGAALLLAFALSREAAAQNASSNSTTPLPGGTQGAAPPAPATDASRANEGPRTSSVAAPYVADPLESKTTRDRRWYGWQIIIADVASTAAFITFVNREQGGYAFLPYLLLAPSVHVANGQPLNGLASVGIRFGVPVVGVLIGAAVESGCTGSMEQCLNGPGYGMLLGMVGAMVIDASVLAYDEPARARHKASTFAPTLAVDQRGARVGLVGSF